MIRPRIPELLKHLMTERLMKLLLMIYILLQDAQTKLLAVIVSLRLAKMILLKINIRLQYIAI